MSRKEVSEWLEIPYRTLTNWENGERPCPTYIEKLIVEKILRDGGENHADEEKVSEYNNKERKVFACYKKQQKKARGLTDNNRVTYKQVEDA